MRIRRLLEHVEMGVLVVMFRAAAWTMSIKQLVRFAAALSERLPPAFVRTDPEEAIGDAERTAERVSRIVPGATCLHRALASRIWLARRGVASTMVVGLRKEGGIEGHAWLEVDARSGFDELFVEEGYRESFREADLVAAAEPDDARLDADRTDRIADRRDDD